MGLGLAYRNIAEVYIDSKSSSSLSFGSTSNSATDYAKKYLDVAQEVGNIAEEQQRALITIGRAALLEFDNGETLNEVKTREQMLVKSNKLAKIEKWFLKAYAVLGDSR
jgi:hypothetical protein